MRHLSAEELIDLAEGARPESSAPHLASCDDCRRQLAGVRATLHAAAEADVPEPSPLFWDHFSARVHEAIAAEGTPRRVAWFGGWSWSRLAMPVSIGALAAIVIAAGLTVRFSHHPDLSTPEAVAEAGAAAEPGIVADDPSLDLVADLTAGLDWDTAGDGGLTTREGTADRAVAQLTEGERRELQRLLEQELKRPSN
jgi:hypothetical protein